MRPSVALPLALALLGACGFERPPQLRSDASLPDDDASPGSDAARDPDAGADAALPPDARPGSTIRVAGTGDDANDGVTAPVKTLKRAIGLAAANDQITSIVLAAGRYATSGGETFPYTVPRDVFVVGPAGGGAILAGSGTEPGMNLATGALQDLELESFTTAIVVTGTARLTNLRIRTGTLGVRVETAGDVIADNLDVAGAVGSCATGLELNGAAALTSGHLQTRNLKTSVHANDQSTLALTSANLTGDGACDPQTGVLLISTTKTFALADSLVDGGGYGIWFASTGTATTATINNTIIRNTKSNAIAASNVTLNMVGGDLTNGQVGVGATSSVVTLSNVTLKQSRGFAAELGDNGTFSMRGCTLSGNGGGVYVFGSMTLDLGTTAVPGNNSLQNSATTPAFEIDTGTAHRVNAVGNTWRPNTQGADNTGHYASQVIVGPVGYDGQTATSNFRFLAGHSVQL